MNTAETIVVLEKARELIAREGGWTQGLSARNAQGNYADIDSDEAICFCAVGAIDRAMGPKASFYGFDRLLDFVHPSDQIVSWNDAPERTQEEVVAAFDAAIARLRTQEDNTDERPTV